MSKRITLDQLHEGEHPTFSNPTLAEVWAEIHFAPQVGQEAWNNEWYGAFFRAIQEKFPRLDPVVQLATVSDDPWQPQVPPGMRYQNLAGDMAVILAPGSVLLHLLGRYASWDHFMSELAFVWDASAEVIDPASVSLAGVRFVDLLPWSPGDPVGEWIQRIPALPAALFEKPQEFLSSFRWVTGATRTQLQIAHALREQDETVLALDMQLRTKGPLPCSWVALRPAFDSLHDQTWNLFVSLMTERYLAHLQQEPES